jgi:hypothetical protein
MDNTVSQSESLRLLTSTSSSCCWSVDAEEEDSSFVPTQHKLEKTMPRPANGLIQTLVTRNGPSYTMSLQAESHDYCILVASKHRGGKFDIRNYDEDQRHILGSLVKEAPCSRSAVSYSLSFGNKEAVVGTIRYEVPSVMEALSAPPRRAQVQVGTNNKNILVETKEPYSKGGGQFGLNFHGRGREPSQKNMQLQDSDGTVILQMVKWGKDRFHVDFK